MLILHSCASAKSGSRYRSTFSMHHGHRPRVSTKSPVERVLPQPLHDWIDVAVNAESERDIGRRRDPKEQRHSAERGRLGRALSSRWEGVLISDLAGGGCEFARSASPMRPRTPSNPSSAGGQIEQRAGHYSATTAGRRSSTSSMPQESRRNDSSQRRRSSTGSYGVR